MPTALSLITTFLSLLFSFSLFLFLLLPLFYLFSYSHGFTLLYSCPSLPPFLLPFRFHSNSQLEATQLWPGNRFDRCNGKWHLGRCLICSYTSYKALQVRGAMRHFWGDREFVWCTFCPLLHMSVSAAKILFSLFICHLLGCALILIWPSQSIGFLSLSPFFPAFFASSSSDQSCFVPNTSSEMPKFL